MEIYFDENIPDKLVNGLNSIIMPLHSNITLKWIPSEFGKGCRDEDWIPILGAKNAFAVTLDKNIYTRPHQWSLCSDNNLSIIFIKMPTKKGWKYWELVSLIIKHWLKLTNLLMNQSRTSAYELTANNVKRI